MIFPPFMMNFGPIDTAFSPEIAKLRGVQSEKGLMALMEVFQDIPATSQCHSARWGTVLEGRLEMTIDDHTSIYKRGDSFQVPKNVTHTVTYYADSTYLHIFEDPDHTF